MSRGIKVLKFGGSSLGTVERIHTVVGIISKVAREHQPIVIVSALQGVTDQLERIADEKDQSLAEEVIQTVVERHIKCASALLKPHEHESYREFVETMTVQLLKRMTFGVSSEIVRDEILAAGERLSAPLVAAALRSSGSDGSAWDAASIVRTDSTFGEATVDWVTTSESIRNWHSSFEGTAVITGFIAGDASGRTTTLGRGGSDYSAAIFASALGASVLERWTDVDGIYTEDPAANRTAKRLAQIATEEARTLNRNGKIGMHRDALDPIARKGIPVHVRSTFRPDREGTWILPKSQIEN
jgi:aspartate kinase